MIASGVDTVTRTVILLDMDQFERSLLQEASEKKLTVLSTARDKRYETANALAERGLLKFTQCAGRMGAGTSEVRVSYALTEDGRKELYNELLLEGA